MLPDAGLDVVLPLFSTGTVFLQRSSLKLDLPGLLFSLFRLFKQSVQFLQQIYVKKCPSNIRSWDANPQPSVHESPPKATRPGLPPNNVHLYSNLSLPLALTGQE